MSSVVDFNKRWGENILRRFIRKHCLGMSYEELLSELGCRVDTEIFPSIFVRVDEKGNFIFEGVHRHAQNN